MSERVVDFFVVRHAEPEYLAPDSNVELNPETLSEIDTAAIAINDALDNQGRFTIYTSPAQRALATSEGLIRSEVLRDRLTQNVPKVTPLLTEEGTLEIPERDKLTKWGTALRGMANFAIAMSYRGEKPGVIVVTHEPVILDIPILKIQEEKYRKKLNLGYLGINRFNWSA